MTFWGKKWGRTFLASKKYDAVERCIRERFPELLCRVSAVKPQPRLWLSDPCLQPWLMIAYRSWPSPTPRVWFTSAFLPHRKFLVDASTACLITSRVPPSRFDGFSLSLIFCWHFLCYDNFRVHRVLSLRRDGWPLCFVHPPSILRVLPQSREIRKPNLSCCWRRETRATRLVSCATWSEQMPRFPRSSMSLPQGFWKPKKIKKPGGLFVCILRRLVFASKPFFK